MYIYNLRLNLSLVWNLSPRYPMSRVHAIQNLPARVNLYSKPHFLRPRKVLTISGGKDSSLDLQFDAWNTSYPKGRTDNLRCHNVFLSVAQLFVTLKDYLGPSAKPILCNPVCEPSLV